MTDLSTARGGRRTAVSAIAIAALMTLTACGENVREAFGLARNTPDEFAVRARAPLSIPPNYDLRPPVPGAPRPQEVSARELASDALAPAADGAGDGVDVSGSPAEAAFMAQMTVGGVDPDIRRLIDLETADLLRADESFVENLMFWQPEEPESLVDPEAERERLAAAIARGEPLNTGDVPVIQREERGSLLGSLGDLMSF